MPNNLDANITNKTIQYANNESLVKNLRPRFISFLNSSYSDNWKKASISFLNKIMMSNSDFSKSKREYIKVSEVADKNLQTELETKITGFIQNIDSDYNKFNSQLAAAKKRQSQGLEGKFIVSHIPLLKKHVNLISAKFDKEISDLNKRETSGDDRHFIVAHNVIILLNKFCNLMKTMIGSLSYGGSRRSSREDSSVSNIFSKNNIMQVVCGSFEKDSTSHFTIKFTSKSQKKVKIYLSQSEISAGTSTNITQSIKNDFIKFIEETNTANKASNFKNFLDNIPISGYSLNYSNDSLPKITLEFNSPSDSGEYYIYEGGDFEAKSPYKVKSSSDSNDFVFSKKNIVENIIKKAIGEAPLYKCKHKGKWYYYTPTQLVLGGGKLTDSSGNKFRPKNGKPASLSGKKK